MIHCVVQLALTLAGAYLSFYVANGPCEFSGKPPLGTAYFCSSLLCCPYALIMPTCSDHAYRLICASQHVPHDLVITIRQAFASLSA